MKKSVLITAVSGSGKSTVCKALVDLGYEAYDIESIPGLFTLVDEETGKPIPGKDIGDLARNTDGEWVCDLEKLKSIIAKQQSEIAFYCGGTSRTEEMMAIFDHTAVLQVSDETTLARLSTRQAHEFGGTDDVRNWVLSWKHRVEAD
ncbi:MAG TPA: AAA family ATPase [Candidatus Saccharimonadales bacterium]|nr:AAA family ATPase [Candidatus Saccharimonadales bacterium]